MEKIQDLIQVNVKHTFSEEELKAESTLLAQAVQNKTSVEADKKVAMSGFTNTIKKLDADINIHSSNYNAGYTYRDQPCELWLDYETNTRCYKNKHTGLEVKHEPFYAGDYQKKIDFTGVNPDTQAQIDENNDIGDYAEDGLFRDNNGNLTDIHPAELQREFEEDHGAKVLDGIVKDKVEKFKASKKK